MKKIAIWTISSILALMLAFILAQTVASERVEVVELYTLDDGGEEQTTRLWVVDHGGFQYLRVGAEGSGWYSRIQANPTIRVKRADEVLPYHAVANPDKSEIINRLMKAKYTWGDAFFATLFGGREGSVPVELQPVPAESR